MQNVVISKKNYDFFQKNELLTLEQAQWFTQDKGFIPLPRKCNKKNTYVIFTKFPNYFFIKLKNKKITKFRVSKVINNKYHLLNSDNIIVLEIEDCSSNNLYFFDTLKDMYVLSEKKLLSIFEKHQLDYLSDLTLSY